MLENNREEILKDVLRLRDEIADFNEMLKMKKSELENYEEYLINDMLETGTKSFKNMNGVGVTVIEKDTFTVLAENKKKFHSWLRELGFEHIIKTDVNYQTMQGFFKKDYDGDIPPYINRSIKTGLSIRRKK